MSDYLRKKAVRYRFTEEDLAKVEEAWDYEDKIPCDLKADFYASRSSGKPGFEIDCGVDYISCTKDKRWQSEYYLDWVLESEYGSTRGDFEKSRRLSEVELAAYIDKFRQIVPDADPENFRLVEFCYYNGCDAPAVFDETCDAFNRPIV